MAKHRGIYKRKGSDIWQLRYADITGKIIRVSSDTMNYKKNNKIINTLKHTYTKAVEWNMVEEGVIKKIRKVKLFKEIGRLRDLSAHEAQGLISVCEPHLQPIVILPYIRE